DFPTTARRIVSEGVALPSSVEKMLAAGATSFYRAEPKSQYFDLQSNAYHELEPRPGIVTLAGAKRSNGVVKKNPGGSLIDLGDGALCVEFHSKLNSVGEDTVAIIHAGLEETARNFAAMIVANQGENFCAGANLLLVLLMAQEDE